MATQMLYYVRYPKGSNHGTLIECTAFERISLFAGLEKRGDDCFGNPDTGPYWVGVHATRARELVKDGYHHETALYVDDNGKVQRGEE